MSQLILFHFKRDLRLEDNAGLYEALKRASELSRAGHTTRVLGLFVFDTYILSKLPFKNDRRVNFIFYHIGRLKEQLQALGSDLLILHGEPKREIERWIENNTRSNSQRIFAYYANFDDDPYPLWRDSALKECFKKQGVKFHLFKDHVIFARNEILNQQRKPYTVFTPYKKAWLEKLKNTFYIKPYPVEKYFSYLFQGSISYSTFTLKDLGFEVADIKNFAEPHLDLPTISSYQERRDTPSANATSRLGIHLRFGTISPRFIVRSTLDISDVFVSELAWRDFFAQILYHYPHVVQKSFRPIYENVPWRKSEEELQRWKDGQTGYPLVDAGMRELFVTGYMHNRVRMVVASFLCKHLLHHWLEGERYFSTLLLDYDLASNNGNWQWAAGTGCDAAPYFRIFNPTTQMEKFDPKEIYVKTWIQEWGSSSYPKPMVEHTYARARALESFKKGLGR